MGGIQFSFQKGNPCDVISESLLCQGETLFWWHTRSFQSDVTHIRCISEWMEDFCSMNASAGHREPSWRVCVLLTIRTISFNNDRTGGEKSVENTAQGRWGHGKPGNIRENIWKGKSHGLFYNKFTFSWSCCTWRNERHIFHRAAFKSAAALSFWTQISAMV